MSIDAQQNLDDSTIERIADLVVEKLRARPEPERTGDVMTRAEAMAYAKKRSDSGFDRWAQRWGVQRTGHGRYSRAKLDLALAREAGLVRTPASLKKAQLERNAA